ncbi:MAG: type II secretion system protein GspN, partial [Bdellovibrionales bacterium GWB1_52_6]
MTENEEIVTEATLPGAEASGVALPASRSKKLIKRLGWIALGFFCLLAFTLIKLPREQIQAYIHGSITSALAEQGYSLTAGQTQLSYFLGITYSMKEVKLATPTGNVIRLDQIEVSPSLFPLFVGKVGASYSIQTPGNGKVSGKLAANKKAYATSFKVNSVDLKTSGLLEGLAHLSAAGLVNGSGDLKGDFTNPATTQGDLKLDLTKLIIEQQQIMGFNIPKLSISEGKADVVITQGKAQ